MCILRTMSRKVGDILVTSGMCVFEIPYHKILCWRKKMFQMFKTIKPNECQPTRIRLFAKTGKYFICMMHLTITICVNDFWLNWAAGIGPAADAIYKGIHDVKTFSRVKMYVRSKWLRLSTKFTPIWVNFFKIWSRYSVKQHLNWPQDWWLRSQKFFMSLWS